MASIQDAIQQSPPGPNGDTANPCQNYVVTAAAIATAVAEVLPNAGGIPDRGCYVTWTAAVDCHIRVGRSGMSVATTSDFFLAAGAERNWWHDKYYDTHFSVIRAASATVDGPVDRYRSKR